MNSYTVDRSCGLWAISETWGPLGISNGVVVALRGAERGSLCKCALGDQERMGRSQDPCSQGANILALEETWVPTDTESHEAAPGQGAETPSEGQVCVVLGSGDLTRWPRPGSPNPTPRGPQGPSTLL